MNPQMDGGRSPAMPACADQERNNARVDDHCGILVFAAGFVAGGRLEPPVGAQGFTVVTDCGAASAPQLRTMLHFGLARPKGAVTELEWQLFLRDEVTSRFPEGLTVWEAEGQWRTPAGNLDHEAVEGPRSGSIPIRRRRGNRSSPLSRRIARRSSSNPSVGKRARVWRGLAPEGCRRALSRYAGSR